MFEILRKDDFLKSLDIVDHEGRGIMILKGLTIDCPSFVFVVSAERCQDGVGVIAPADDAFVFFLLKDVVCFLYEIADIPAPSFFLFFRGEVSRRMVFFPYDRLRQGFNPDDG